MSFHGIIVFIVSLLAAFAQVEFQSKSVSPFDRHGKLMSTFFVVLFTFVVGWVIETIQAQAQAQNTRNDSHIFWTKISLISGTLASILLLILIRQVLGWVFLILWILYFLKTVYELVKGAIFGIFDKLSKAIHGRFDHKEQDKLPV